MIKTGKFKMSVELAQDLWVAKHFDFDGITPPWGFKKNKKNFNVETELQHLKQSAIDDIIGKGKFLSITSERKTDAINFVPYDEFTVTYKI